MKYVKNIRSIYGLCKYIIILIIYGLCKYISLKLLLPTISYMGMFTADSEFVSFMIKSISVGKFEYIDIQIREMVLKGF